MLECLTRAFSKAVQVLKVVEDADGNAKQVQSDALEVFDDVHTLVGYTKADVLFVSVGEVGLVAHQFHTHFVQFKRKLASEGPKTFVQVFQILDDFFLVLAFHNLSSELAVELLFFGKVCFFLLFPLNVFANNDLIPHVVGKTWSSVVVLGSDGLQDVVEH